MCKKKKQVLRQRSNKASTHRHTHTHVHTHKVHCSQRADHPYLSFRKSICLHLVSFGSVLPYVIKSPTLPFVLEGILTDENLLLSFGRREVSKTRKQQQKKGGLVWHSHRLPSTLLIVNVHLNFSAEFVIKNREYLCSFSWPSNTNKQVNKSGKSLSELKLLRLAPVAANSYFMKRSRKQLKCLCQSGCWS